jgi:hypothetical protein
MIVAESTFVNNPRHMLGFDATIASGRKIRDEHSEVVGISTVTNVVHSPAIVKQTLPNSNFLSGHKSLIRTTCFVGS